MAVTGMVHAIVKHAEYGVWKRYNVGAYFIRVARKHELFFSAVKL
jgi:hypothetical protein